MSRPSEDNDWYGDLRPILDDDLARFVAEKDRYRSLTVVNDPRDRDGEADTRRWLDRLRDDPATTDQCAAMRRAVERHADGSRDGQIRGALAVVRLDELGHAGVAGALDGLWSVRARDRRDFDRVLAFARRRVVDSPSPANRRGCRCSPPAQEKTTRTTGDDEFDSTGAPILPPPTDPMAVSRRLVMQYEAGEGLMIRWWRGGWMRHRGASWAEDEDTVIRKWIYQHLEHAQYWHTPPPTKANPTPDPELRPWQPNRRKVSDVLDALTAITHLPEDIDPPAWLDHPNPPAPADRIVACANGLLDVGTRALHPLTPRYFNRVAVPFDFDPDVGRPELWLAFLRQLWPDDADAIAAIQEYFGYVLSGRTDLQKILLLIGPTRSGKGTIARILAALVGKGNSAGPTLASLGTNFGLAPLLGKPLAIVSDARLGGANVHQVVERLLSISGEDMLTVDRKFREPWTGKLPSRFIVLSNELPRFGDASGAIANRFIVLSMNNSFLGRENTRLTADLLAELPAILGWALDGLDRLATANTFTTPSSSGDAVSALQDLVSPVAAFVRDACTVKAGAEVVVSDLFSTWKAWCEDNGHRPGSLQTFGRDLRAVVPALRVTRPHGDVRRYVGLSVNGVCNGEPRGSTRFSGSDDDVNRNANRNASEGNRRSETLNRTEPRSEPLQAEHEAEPRPTPVWRVSGRPA